MSTKQASIADLNETLLSEVLSYFTLDEIGKSSRIVSKSFYAACQERKETHFKHLSTKNAVVQIIGLQTAKGKTYNFKIGNIRSRKGQKKGQKKVSTRFQVQVVNRITAEAEIISVKACNTNIYPSSKTLQNHQKQLKLTNYCNNAKIRAPHGMLLDECIRLSRWHCNLMCGMLFYPHDDQTFMRLPATHPAMYRSSATMFSYWNVTKPGVVGDFPKTGVLDMTVSFLVQAEKEIAQEHGRTANWEADGNNGELILRHYVRFMKSWLKERISGKFWVTKVCKTGTILVREDEDDDSLCEVYLVRGVNSVIGEILPSLPTCCTATILPVYHFLVYDGILVPVTDPLLSIDGSFRNRLSEHVQNAIDQDTVITMGESARKGLWDSPPPPLPFVSKDKMTVDWNRGYNEGNEKDGSVKKKTRPQDKPPREFTSQEKKVATKIAKVVKKKGVLRSSLLDKKYRTDNILVFRRYGYTEKENPDKMCVLMFNSMPVDSFYFQNDLTYNLEEVLDALLNKIVRRFGMPPIILCDESSINEPLQRILIQYLGDVGVKDEVKVEWYPPPTKEETQMAMITGRMMGL